MKKFWLIAILSALILNTSNAQRTRFAIFANPLVSYFKTDLSRIAPDGSRVGINVGLMMDRFFAEHYAFATGISLQTMGGSLYYEKGKTDFSTSDTLRSLPPNTSVKYKLQYIHIPIALKLRTTEIGYTTFFAQLGFDPMINVKANADIPFLSVTDIGVGGEIRLFYLAYHIGLGLEYKIVGSTALMLGLTYMNGFSDVTSNIGNSAEKTVMHSFELRLGVIF